MTALARIRRVARNYADAVRRPAASAASAREQRLGFLFCGRASFWRESGLQLYRDHALFRDGIDAADPIVRDIVGFSPSAAFAGHWQPETHAEDAQGEILATVLLGMGLADLWRHHCGGEAAFIGISGGEVASAYAADALSRDDAVRVISWCARALDHLEVRCPSFVIEARPAFAAQLCRSAPGKLEFAGEVVPGVSHLHSAEEDADANRAFLTGQVALLDEYVSNHRYHVPSTPFDEPFFLSGLSISPRPPRQPLYFSSFGGRVPPDCLLTVEHWAWMVTSPYRTAGACAAAIDDGIDLLMVGGPRAIGQWFAETAQRKNRPAHFLRPLETPAGEDAWQGFQEKLERAPLAAPRAAAVPAESVPIDLAQPQHLSDPFAAYEKMRRHGPVHYLPSQNFWIVLSHADVKLASERPQTFSNAPYDYVDHVLIGEDPPRHAAARRIVSRRFSAAIVARLQAHAGMIGRALLRPRFDLVEDYAAPLARAVAAELTGFDAEAVAEIEAGTERARRDPAPFRALSAILDDMAHRAAIYDRLREDGDGLFADADLRSLVRFLWHAATTTTERAIVRAAMHLVSDEALLATLRADRRLMAPFVEEILRLYPPHHMIPRRMAQAARLGGVDIPAGADVQLCTAAANRDPGLFDQPAALRLDRKTEHLTFGSGVHHCSGTAMARRIVPAALGVLLDAPALRTIQPLDTVDYQKSVMAIVPTQVVIGT